MKRFTKVISAVFIDLTLIAVLSIVFSVIAGNAFGLIFSRVQFFSEVSFVENLRIWIKPVFFFLPAYVVVSLLFKNSIGWLATKKGKFSKAVKLVFSNVIDFTVVLLLTILSDYVLQTLFYYDFFVLLLVILATYYFTVALLNGVSLGKWCFGIKFNPCNRKTVLKYTFAKIVCILIFPSILFGILGIVEPYALFLNIVLCFFIFHVFLDTVFKTPPWTHFAKVNYVFYKQKAKFIMGKLACLLLLFTIGFISIKFINNNIHRNDDRFLFGFNYPYEFKKYPHVKTVQPYTDFLKTQNQSPKDYVLSLFKQYDIVILQEAYHGENTQWEMIFDIVSDTAFIHNVGNIFTEYGSARHQDKIDTFLNTVFPNDTILEQETACLMYYMSGSYYYFIKNLNLLNSQLPDSLKVREHFCDVQIDCDDIVTFIRSKAEANPNRDSLMAQVTIDWYNEQAAAGKRNKCLVVTNYRHAHGYAGGVDYVKKQSTFRNLTKGNQGQYIWEQFPDKTATVMQSQFGKLRTLFIPFPNPAQKGKWDLAFEINHNKPVGFDLKNTPFGKDYYDLYPLNGTKNNLKYEDLFTGMIFNKPYLELNSVEHPYQRHAVLQAIKTKNIDLDASQNKRYLLYSQYFDDEAHLEKNMIWARSISLANFAPIFVYMLLSFISLSSMLWFFALNLCDRGANALKFL